MKKINIFLNLMKLLKKEGKSLTGFTPLEMCKKKVLFIKNAGERETLVVAGNTARRLPKGNLSLTGFTMVELMVVLVIFLVVISGVFAVLSGGRRAWLVSEAQIDVNSKAREIMHKITDDLSQAAPGNVTITTVSASEDNITFQIPDSFSSGVITWSDQYQYSLGGLNGEQIVRTNLTTSATETFGNYISSLQFSLPNTDTVLVVLGLTRESLLEDNLQLQITSRVTLRNR